MPKSKQEKIIFHGKNIIGHLYTVNVDVVDKVIVSIEIKGKPNLFVKELCEKFARKRPDNVRDVLDVVKLKMIKCCEFVREENVRVKADDCKDEQDKQDVKDERDGEEV